MLTQVWSPARTRTLRPTHIVCIQVKCHFQHALQRHNSTHHFTPPRRFHWTSTSSTQMICVLHTNKQQTDFQLKTYVLLDATQHPSSQAIFLTWLRPSIFGFFCNTLLGLALGLGISYIYYMNLRTKAERNYVVSVVVLYLYCPHSMNHAVNA